MGGLLWQNYSDMVQVYCSWLQKYCKDEKFSPCFLVLTTIRHMAALKRLSGSWLYSPSAQKQFHCSCFTDFAHKCPFPWYKKGHSTAQQFYVLGVPDFMQISCVHLWYRINSWLPIHQWRRRGQTAPWAVIRWQQKYENLSSLLL